jgi:hypothetical protein
MWIIPDATPQGVSNVSPKHVPANMSCTLRTTYVHMYTSQASPQELCVCCRPNVLRSGLLLLGPDQHWRSQCMSPIALIVPHGRLVFFLPLLLRLVLPPQRQELSHQTNPPRVCLLRRDFRFLFSSLPFIFIRVTLFPVSPLTLHNTHISPTPFLLLDRLSPSFPSPVLELRNHCVLVYLSSTPGQLRAALLVRQRARFWTKHSRLAINDCLQATRDLLCRSNINERPGEHHGPQSQSCRRLRRLLLNLPPQAPQVKKAMGQHMRLPTRE